MTKASLKEQFSKLPDKPENGEERDALKQCLALIDAEDDAAKKVRDAQAELDLQVLKKYGALSESEIKSLVIQDKWMASIQRAIADEVERITHALATRVQELEDRYADTVAKLVFDVEELSSRVNEHLRAMGMVLA